MKDHVEIGHLTKYDAFRVNRDQVMDLEIWFKTILRDSVAQTPKPRFFFFGRDETEHIRIKNFIILSVSGIFKGFKN